MPKIGNYTPNEPFNQVIQNSPGPISAPNLPDTGSALAEGNIRNASQSATNVAESGALGLRTISNVVNDVGGAIMAVNAAKQRHNANTAKLKAAQTAAQVSALSTPLNFQLDDSLLAARSSDPNNPKNQLTTFENSTVKTFDKFIESKGIKDQDVIDGLKKHYDAGVQVRHYQLANSIPGQDNAIIAKDAQNSVGQAVLESGKNFNSLGTSLQSLNDLVIAKKLSDVNGIKVLNEALPKIYTQHWEAGLTPSADGSYPNAARGAAETADPSDDMRKAVPMQMINQYNKRYQNILDTQQASKDQDIKDNVAASVASYKSSNVVFEADLPKMVAGKDQKAVGLTLDKLYKNEQDIDNHKNWSEEQKLSARENVKTAIDKFEAAKKSLKEDADKAAKDAAKQHTADTYKAGQPARDALQTDYETLRKSYTGVGAKGVPLSEAIDFRDKADQMYAKGQLSDTEHKAFHAYGQSSIDANLKKTPPDPVLMRIFNYGLGDPPANYMHMMTSRFPKMTGDESKSLYRQNMLKAINASGAKTDEELSRVRAKVIKYLGGF
jgi:hypothetical protein